VPKTCRPPSRPRDRAPRIALIGSLAGQLGPGNGTTSAVELDSFQLIVKQLTLKGYSGGHDPALAREWRQRFAGWLRSGQIRFPHTLIPGIAGAPQALDDVVAGRYQGAVLVAL
jgi:NADPH-dependent curcumin reductase CurA